MVFFISLVSKLKRLKKKMHVFKHTWKLGVLIVPKNVNCILQRMMGVDGVPMMNGSGVHGGEDYQRWMETRAVHEKPAHRHGGETFSNTLPVRKVVPVKPKNTLGKLRNLTLKMQTVTL